MAGYNAVPEADRGADHAHDFGAIRFLIEITYQRPVQDPQRCGPQPLYGSPCQQVLERIGKSAPHSPTGEQQQPRQQHGHLRPKRSASTPATGVINALGSVKQVIRSATPAAS